MIYLIIIIICCIIFFIIKTVKKKRKIRPLPDSTKSEILKLKELSYTTLPEDLESALSDKYKNMETISAGGMGVITSAIDRKSEKKVAIKTVLPELGSNQKAIALFYSECEAIKKMNHPNIVRIYDVGDNNGLYYYIMEYLKGINLDKKISKEKKLSIAETIKIGTQIARALQHCHSNKIIHRDIKPSNIFITIKNTAKIIDFGIVKLFSGDTSLKMNSTKIGTPDYASPEQLQGQPISGKSDIYALGVCMYQMLSGKMPFKNSGMMSKMFDKPRDIKEFRKDIPEDLIEIVNTCLELDPIARYTANELWTKLKSVKY